MRGHASAFKMIANSVTQPFKYPSLALTLQYCACAEVLFLRISFTSRNAFISLSKDEMSFHKVFSGLII